MSNLNKLILTVMSVSLIVSCSDSSFSGAGGQKSKKQSDNNIPSNGEDSSGNDQPGQVDENGVVVVEADRCANPTGTAKSQVRIYGEDFPNNPFDSGGFDNDDYELTISGSVVVENSKIGTKTAQDIEFDYQRRGSKCHHRIEIRFRNCADHKSTVLHQEVMDAGSTSSLAKTISAPKNSFVDIHLKTDNCPYSGMSGLSADVDLYKSAGQFFDFQ